MNLRISFTKAAAASLLALAACLCAGAQDDAVTSIDLTAYGLPSDAFNPARLARCPDPYMGYHAVRWIDDERVLVAFNTSSLCPKGDDFHTRASLKLLVIDLRGVQLKDANIPYETATNKSVFHDGIWIGPERTILIESPWIHTVTGPEFPGKIRIFNDDLQPIQEIETESSATMRGYGTFTHDALHIEGVSADRQSVLFSTDSAPGRKCLLYSGSPLKYITDCPASALEALKTALLNPGNFSIPDDSEVPYESPGISTDGSRAGVFISYKANGACQVARDLCSKSGSVVIFDTQTKRVVFRKDLPVSSWTALSPDGKHLAVFSKKKLEIFPIP